MSISVTANNSTMTALRSTSNVNNPAFWERLWHTSGIQFVTFFIITYLIYGDQPRVGASSEALVAFYTGERARILLAVIFSGLNILNLMWFAASLGTTLADEGQEGWGAAATASSAALGGLCLMLISILATLAYSVAVSGNSTLTSGLNDFAWAIVVLSSFPRAMLIMSGTFGLWRAGLISNALFAAGVGAVGLGVLGGTTWISGGFWSPDGVYSRIIFPIVGLIWVLVVSRALLTKGRTARAAW